MGQVRTGQDNIRLDRSGPERKGEDMSVTITIIKKTLRLIRLG